MPGGVSTSTAAHTFKVAFYNAAVALYAADEDTTAVQVVFGRPAKFLEADVVAFGRVGAPQEAATMGTNRGRDETLEQEVHISCWVPGGPEAEITASARAYELLAMLEYFARVTDTTIGDSVRECFLAEHESDGMTPTRLLPQGRNITVTATFQAKNRISS